MYIYPISAHIIFRDRNLLWLAALNAVYIIRPPLYTRWEGLLQLGLVRYRPSLSRSRSFLLCSRARVCMISSQLSL